MVKSIIQLFPEVPPSQNNEFKQQKFNQNNFRILIISIFLILEQTYYCFFISKPGSLLQKIYFSTALILLIFTAISLYFYSNKPTNISILHLIYESSIGVFGLSIAIIRAAFVHHQVFRLPTIYVAVIYGMAVIFYYSYKQSFLIYFSGAVTLLLVLPIYKPALQSSSYIADTISNSLIAWIASMANYQLYIKEFINTKTIEDKNKELVKKNKQINEINDKLQKISITDELTGIYNRRKIEEVLSRIYAEAKRYNKQFSVILLDLDHFKNVNDTFGHQLGDEILIKVSSLLIKNIRDVDTCGRWGGEEFLIICPVTDLPSAVNLAQRLRKLIENTTFPKIEKITSSFGVASYSKGDKIKDIIKRADDSLYKAKEKGRNKVETIENN